MHVETVNQCPVSQPNEDKRLFQVDAAACEKLKALLNGPEEAKRAYLREQSFSYENLPEWLRAEAFQLAKLEFDKASTPAVLSDLYGRFVGHAKVPSYFRRNASPASMASRLHSTNTLRKEIAQDLSTFLPATFTPEIFKQAGFHRSTTLEQLVNARGDSATFAGTDVAAPTCLGSVNIKVFHEQITLPVLLPVFDPRLEGPLGRAAIAVREVVGSRIVAFALVSDLARAFGIVLEEHKLRKLVQDLQVDPWLKAKHSPVIRSLLAYSEHLVAEGIPSRIPVQEVFGSFAFHRQPIEDMRSENKRRERQAEASTTAVAYKTEPSTVLTLPPIDESTSKIKEIIESRTGARVDSIGSGMRLLRLCVSHGVSPRDLERLMDAQSGDPVQVIRAIQQPPQAAPSSDVVDKEESKCILKPPSLTPRFAVYAHSGDNGFSKWFESLSVEEQKRVSEVISDVAHERFGKARPIKTQKFSGIYEMRIMDLGLRVYFKYLPGQRLLLLCGGHKSDQQRDISRASTYSKEYRAREDQVLDESFRFPLNNPEKE